MHTPVAPRAKPLASPISFPLPDTPSPTAPPAVRSPMRPHPWFGFMRGLLFALWPGAGWPQTRQVVTPWRQAASRRRSVLLAVTAALSASGLAFQLAAAPDELSIGWVLATVLSTLLFAWVGVGFATALMGAWVLWRGDPHALRVNNPPAPIDKQARTALIMPICNEDIATVFGGLRATCESLAATGALALFDVYVLSDSTDPVLVAAEQQAWARLRANLGDDPVGAGARIFYRHRRHRTRRKAGNVADFCRRWGSQYRYMVVLDADSTMRGDTLVSLVRLMEQTPQAGIIQTLPQSSGHSTLHARAQQFGSRLTGRLFSAGMAYWQLGDSHYWGHNAILRVAPFMQHCALAPLPGRGGLAGDILSHDFVEAALMGRAGWDVWLLPDLQGSWEQNPPHLLDELQRDRRWCQGNLQNARLVAEPGWRPAHRVMFATGALSYLTGPLWLAFVIAGFASNGGGGGISVALWALTLLLLLLPRVLGVLGVLVRGEQAAFGGSARLVWGATVEMLLSALQAPLRMVAHTSFVVGALTGLQLKWKSPARADSGVAWHTAFTRIGVLCLAALGSLGGLLLALRGRLVATPQGLLQLLPLMLPLGLAAPFAVATGNPRLGTWFDRLGLFWMAEERRLPRPLAQASQRRAWLDLVPAPVPVAAVPGARWHAPRRPFVLAAAFATLAVAVLLPRTGVAPELSPALQVERSIAQWMAPSAEPEAAPVMVATAVRKRPMRVQPTRPARMIDNAVRRRAVEAVERALAEEASPA